MLSSFNNSEKSETFFMFFFEFYLIGMALLIFSCLAENPLLGLD